MSAGGNYDFDVSSVRTEEDPIDIQELSVRLQIPKATIYYWVSRFEIPFLKVGKHLRFEFRRVMEHFRERSKDGGDPCQRLRRDVRPRRKRSVTIKDTDHADSKKE